VIADRELAPDLLVRIHCPDSGERLPAIVFSHGLGGSRLMYPYLARAWVARGFVVVLPSHREAVPPGVVEIEQPSIAEMRAMKEAIDNPRNWPLRPLDVQRTIDGLEALSLPVTIDLGRIGIGGHSYGAYTALLCAGARVRIEGELRSFEESRAQAFVAISPPGNGSRGLEAASWATIARPTLCLTGTRDEGILGEPAVWREDAFRAMPGPNAGLVVLDGAEHMTFAGGRPRRPALREHLDATIAATSWFWDKHLRGVDAPFPPLPDARVEWK
jgi:predicted dienelactone hydrolase